jgi:acyl-[acyl-carrier-protein]-phospholipid O-acyltransferase/long-chain-fatty-acid--[acyl-carrier-protein] ligase
MTSAGLPTFDIKTAQQPIFHALLRARLLHGGGTPALVDGDGRVLTYDDIIRASFALGNALKRGTRAGESVG